MNSLSSGISMTDVSKSYREERDMKQIYEKKLKDGYRYELEKQMELNKRKREQEDFNRKNQEITILKTYPPFGRRSEFYLNHPQSEFDNLSQSGSEKGFSIADLERRRESNISNNLNEKPNNQNKVVSMHEVEFNKNIVNIPTNHPEKFNSPYNEFLTYDPNKDIKPVFGATIGQDPYFPWGKPGHGAPRVDPSSGTRDTRIAGNLWYHVNGQTPSDRKERLEHYNRINTGRNIAINSSVPRKLNPNSLSLNPDDWILKKKEEYSYKMDQNPTSRAPSATKLTNYNPQKSYETSRANGMWFDSTFGRPGNGAPTYDARRKNLNEALESPRSYGSNYGIPNIVFPKTNPRIASSHRNGFDFIPPGQKF